MTPGRAFRLLGVGVTGFSDAAEAEDAQASEPEAQQRLGL